jgi:hypothetical protein
VLKQVLEKQLSERAALNLALASAVISRALYIVVLRDTDIFTHDKYREIR